MSDQGSKGYKCSMPDTVHIKGWRKYGSLFILLGTVSLFLWPVVVDPCLRINEYKKRHEYIQAELEAVGYRQQPGQLRKFESPWKKKFERETEK